VDTVFLSGCLVSEEQVQLGSPCASPGMEDVAHSENLKDLNVAFTKLQTVIHIYRQREEWSYTHFISGEE